MQTDVIPPSCADLLIDLYVDTPLPQTRGLTDAMRVDSRWCVAVPLPRTAHPPLKSVSLRTRSACKEREDDAAF